MDCKDSAKINQHCYQKLYRTSGCTAPIQQVTQAYPSSTTVKQVKTDLQKIITSDNPDDLRRCYGSSSEAGYGSTMPYLRESSTTNQCAGDLKEKGDLIKCDKCDKQLGRPEGVWLYKNGQRIKIPDCDCPAAYVAADIKTSHTQSRDVCGNSYSKGKPVEIQQDDCAIYDAWNNPDINWYYGGKGLGTSDKGGIQSDDTIFYTTPTTIYQIPEGKCQVQCQGNSINICDKTKVKKCQASGSKCVQDCNITVPNPTQPKNLEPNCFYSIPFSNGGGNTLNYKFGNQDVKISAMNCKDPTYFHQSGLDAIIYITKPTPNSPGPVYIFRNHEYFRLNKESSFYQVYDGYPKQITSGWSGIPASILPMDAAYYDDTHQILQIFKADTVYLYDCNHDKMVATHKISDYYPGVPDNLDGVVRVGSSLLFFQEGQVYQKNTPQILLGPVATVLPSPMTIVLKMTGMCLDFLPWYGITSAAAYEPNQQLRLSPCRNDWRQQWVYDSWSQVIMNPATGLCLSGVGYDTNYKDGRVITEYCSGSPSQRWRIDTSKSMIINIMTGWALQADPSAPSNSSLSDGFLGVSCSSSTSGDPNLSKWTSPFGTSDNDWLHSGIGSAGNDGVMTIASNQTSFDTCVYDNCDKAVTCPGDNYRYKQYKGKYKDKLCFAPGSGFGALEERAPHSWCSLITDDDDVNQEIADNKGVYCPIKTKLGNPGISDAGSSINPLPGVSQTNPAMNSWAWNTGKDGPVSMVASTGWQNLPNQRWIYVPDNHSIINPATGYRLAIVGRAKQLGGLQWNSSTGIGLQPWVKSAGWSPTGGFGNGELDTYAFLVVLSPDSGDKNGVYGKGGCFRWHVNGYDWATPKPFLGYAQYTDDWGVTPKTGNGPLALLANNSPLSLPNGIKPWFATQWSWCSGKTSNTGQLCGGANSWTALSSKYPLPGAPLGTFGMGGMSGNLYLVTGVNNQLAVGATDETSVDTRLQKQNISVTSYSNAQKIAERLGGRVAYEYELKCPTSGFAKVLKDTPGIDKVSGWTTTYSSQSSANIGKQYTTTTIKFKSGGSIPGWTRGSKSQTGVWMVVPGGGLAKDMGERVCTYDTMDMERVGSTWNAQVPVWRPARNMGNSVDTNQNNRVCDILGGCMKNWSCTQPNYTTIQPTTKHINAKFSGIPEYLNSVFYDHTKLYFIKGKQVFEYAGHNSTQRSSGGDSGSQTHSISDVFHKYPILPNLYNDVTQKSEDMSGEYRNFKTRELGEYSRNHTILSSGRRALRKSSQLLNDKNRQYTTRHNKIQKLNSSIQTDQRQGEIGQYHFSRFDFYIKYMKYGLTWMLIELVIVMVYRGGLLAGFTKKHTAVVMMIVAAVFIVVLIPMILRDIDGSNLRWGKIKWEAGKIPADQYKTPDSSTTGAHSLTDSLGKLKHELKAAKCSSQTTGKTSMSKPKLKGVTNKNM